MLNGVPERCTNFSEFQKPPQNSKHPKGDVNQVPYWRPTNLRHHCTKFTCHPHSIVVLTISPYVLCVSLLYQVWRSKLHSHFKKWIHSTIELLLKSWLNFTPHDIDILISRHFKYCNFYCYIYVCLSVLLMYALLHPYTLLLTA